MRAGSPGHRRLPCEPACPSPAQRARCQLDWLEEAFVSAARRPRRLGPSAHAQGPDAVTPWWDLQEVLVGRGPADGHEGVKDSRSIVRRDGEADAPVAPLAPGGRHARLPPGAAMDRKSTRLNSSHAHKSYAGL